MTRYSLTGFVPDVNYTTFLHKEKLKIYNVDSFNVNSVQKSGLIDLGTPGNYIAYSKWVTPKRTRTYPYRDIYNTYSSNAKRVAIIPIIKDEGKDGENDRINAITFSWMNLINVYIILGWYEDADLNRKNPKKPEKITNQHLNAEYIREKILQISKYQATALHWNTTHFKSDFEKVYLNAVASYEKISQEKDVEMHNPKVHLDTLERYKVDDHFSIDEFKKQTLTRSLGAAHRESVTDHQFESLSEDAKGIFHISNYLGGEYHLTADEIIWENDRLIIQESKNTKGKLPSDVDIRDGLFKLILFKNMEKVKFGSMEDVPFITRLKLTGDLIGNLNLPCADDLVSNFCDNNKLKPAKQKTIKLLNQEATENNLQIWITKHDDKKR